MLVFFKKTLRKVRHLLKLASDEVAYQIYLKYGVRKEAANKVYGFFSHHNGFRVPYRCSEETGIDVKKCEYLKRYLYEKNKLGGYALGTYSHQEYMRERILNKFPSLSKNSLILEIGPGGTPVFPLDDFPNWYGVDKNLDDAGCIHYHKNFKKIKWENPNYALARIIRGEWENLSSVIRGVKPCGASLFVEPASLRVAGSSSLAAIKKEPGLLGTFDLVVASHTYEHVFKPIQCLKEAALCLKKGGIIALFVPNGYSDDPAFRTEITHTLFLVPDMIREFFDYSDSFTDVMIENFRPNFDVFISAVKK